MANILTDGGIVGFSRVLTISAVTYATDDFKFDTPAGVSFERTNHQSVPTGFAMAKGGITGTATLQLATSATAVPEWGASFVETEGTFFITSVGYAQTKNGETKVSISFRKAIGTLATS